jgi:hypothetical protein
VFYKFRDVILNQVRLSAHPSHFTHFPSTHTPAYHTGGALENHFSTPIWCV